MWEMYLETMLQLNENQHEEALFKRRILGRAFKEADEAGKMSEEHYAKYVQILRKTKAEKKIIYEVNSFIWQRGFCTDAVPPLTKSKCPVTNKPFSYLFASKKNLVLKWKFVA